MRRGLLITIVALLVIGAGVFAWYKTRGAASTASAITALLPRDTVALVYLPDVNRTRAEWQQSDIYQLYAEPAVQDFLRHPLARRPNADGDTAKQIEQLNVRDAFAAVTSISTDHVPSVVAGFRFSGTTEAAEKLVAAWQQNSSHGETVEYQQHKIELFNFGVVSLGEVFDGQWFLAATNIDELKLVLDRVDNRPTDRNTLLSADDTYRGTMSAVPSSYALALYIRMEKLAESLAALHQQPGTAGRPAFLSDVRALAATSQFENGRIHDHIFAATNRAAENDSVISRTSLALASADTFLYGASVVNLANGIPAIQPAAGAGFLGGLWQKISNALTRGGIKAEDWQAAFGSETGLLADWPAAAHWPSGVAVFPVKDLARANKIASAVAHALDEDATWIESDRGGAHFITMQMAPGFLTLRPCIAVMEKMMIVGLDPGSVDGAIERSRGSGAGLSSSSAYKTASSAVPAPSTFFAYLDLSLLYSRVDASLRPLLMMGAAFMPKVNDHVDLARLPAAEVVTKHLSPIVTSQRQVNGGYMAESVGPITLNDAGFALLLFGVLHHQSWGIPGGAGPGGGLQAPSNAGTRGVARPPPALKNQTPNPASTP